MKPWTAIVPLNYGRECKTRLAGRLSADQREQLVEAMARHVVRTLAASPGIGAIWLLSPERPPFAGEDWIEANWIEDQGRGLNAELADARNRFAGEPVLFIHADLPLLDPGDVEQLLAAAGPSGVAIAPDLAGQGTNALAISGPLAGLEPFTPAFGADSLRAHKAALPHAAIVTTEGLALDMDEPENLSLAMAKGFAPPFSS